MRKRRTRRRGRGKGREGKGEEEGVEMEKEKKSWKKEKRKKIEEKMCFPSFPSLSYISPFSSLLPLPFFFSLSSLFLFSLFSSLLSLFSLISTLLFSLFFLNCSQWKWDSSLTAFERFELKELSSFLTYSISPSHFILMLSHYSIFFSPLFSFFQSPSVSAEAVHTLRTLGTLDPSFLKTFLIAVLSSSTSATTSSSSTSSLPLFPSTYSSYWMAITTDPKIVHSCSVSTFSTLISEKSHFMCVPHSEKYLQAYVLDGKLLDRILFLLKKIDPKLPYFVENRGNGENGERGKDKEGKKENMECMDEEDSGISDDFKWYRSLENWSNI